MALDETVGGLPADETQIKATMPKTGGLSLAGQKGVSLNPADSSDIRDRLMQMIAQREQSASSWSPIMERAAVSAGGPGTFAQNLQSFNTNQRNKEKELFDMRVGLAQLNTEEARIKQAQEQAAQNQLNFTNALRTEQGLPPLPSAPQAGMAPVPQGGMAPAPQGGMAPAPQGGMAPAPQARPSNITPTQMAMLQQMYADPSTRAEAQKQFIALTKKDDIERRLESAGIVRGSPMWNQMLAVNVAGAGAFTPHDVRTAGGTEQQTPFGAVGSALGTPPPAIRPPAPVTAPAPQGAPVGTAPAPAPVAAAPAPVTPAVALGGGAPTQGSGLSPTSKETLALQQAQAQAKIDVEKERQTETNKQAIAVASKASEALQASADSADRNIMIANRITQNVEKVPELVNLLGKAEVKSALLNLVDQGIKTPGGQLSIAGVNELATQLDPSLRSIKDPKVREARLSAAQELARDFAYLALQGSKVVEGQGAVSDNERALIKQSVGDPSRLTAQNIMNVAKTLKYEAMNAKERRDLWNQMSDSGMTYQQFRKSPEYMDQSKKQYARMARILGIKDAPPFDPALERQ